MTKKAVSDYQNPNSLYWKVFEKIAKQAQDGKGLAPNVYEYIVTHHTLHNEPCFHVDINPAYKGQRVTFSDNKKDLINHPPAHENNKLTIHLLNDNNIELITAANALVTEFAKNDLIAQPQFSLNKTDYTVRKFHEVARERNPRQRQICDNPHKINGKITRPMFLRG
jgi:hypothetical protein